MKPHVTTNALFLRVPYLEELKQHVIEVGGNVHHADGKVLVYTGGHKKGVSLVPLHFKFPTTPPFSISGHYSALGCFTGWRLKKPHVSILSQPT